MLEQITELVFHVDEGIRALFQHHGVVSYLLLWLIVFIETGVVIFPFLPGDSLLFAAGAVAGAGIADPWVLAVVFISAAIAGDNCNFWIGRLIGRGLMKRDYNRLLSKKNLVMTQAYFSRWGVLTLILGRWIPIVRTFVPFVAGLGSMRYPVFVLCSAAGTVVWVALAGGAGLLFGNIPFVKNNFSLAMLAVVAISITPIAIGVLRKQWGSRRPAPGPTQPAPEPARPSQAAEKPAPAHQPSA